MLININTGISLNKKEIINIINSSFLTVTLKTEYSLTISTASGRILLMSSFVNLGLTNLGISTITPYL